MSANLSVAAVPLAVDRLAQSRERLRKALYSAPAPLTETAKTLLLPLAQRHPLGLLLCGLAVGTLLGWSRPWRWIVTPALIVGLLPKLLAKAAALVPSGAWLDILAALTPARAKPQGPAAPQAQARSADNA
jgi:hypothetical protein